MTITASCSTVMHSIREALKHRNDDHRSSDPEFDNLAELAVKVIRFEAGAEIAELMGVVDELRQECSDRQHPTLAAHLAMVSRVLAAAARRRLPLPDGLTDSDRLILSNLGTGALSGREIAGVTGLTAETVARRLPRLRAAGLVSSWKEGRQTTNQRTPSGAAAVLSPKTLEAAPVADPGPTINQDLWTKVRKQRMTPQTG